LKIAEPSYLEKSLKEKALEFQFLRTLHFATVNKLTIAGK